MSLYRSLLRSLRRTSTRATVKTTQNLSFSNYDHEPLQNPNFLLPIRSYAFSSAEEAAAERRRRKRRLRIEPPLYALRREPPSRDPNSRPQDGPRLPDSTSALVGPRLNLHNRVQSLIRAGDHDSAAAVARHSVFSNVRPTVFTCNAIIAAMYRCGRYRDAKVLFQYFFNQFNIIPNVVSYNNLIVSHCESNEVDEGLKVYRHILENAPFSPSAVTYRHLTKGLIDSGRIGEAVDLLREMLNKGHGADSLVYNNLIKGFLDLGNFEKANELFDELKERCTVYDGVVNATFMEWFFNRGEENKAMESYKSLLDKKYRMVPATCNVLLEVLLRHDRKTEAWALFEHMLDDHTPPTFQAVNSDTFNIMVNEYFKEGKVSEAMDVFKKAGKGPKSKPFAMDVAGYNNMITRLCELEMMEESEKYYAEICSKSLSPDVNTYRTMIEAYVKGERVDEALEKSKKMVEAGLRVIPIYANKWFSFLIERGKAADCAPILTKMGEREPKPDVTTYDIVIRGLCNEGNYDSSFDILSQMMNYGVGLTASLKEFVLEAFGKQGRVDEIQRLLARSPFNSPSAWSSGPPRMGGPVMRPGYMPGQAAGGPRSPGQASLHAQIPGQAFGSSPPPGRGSVPSQMPGQAFGSSQLPHQGSVPPQMPWQGFGSSQMTGQGFGSSQMTGQGFGSSQMTGQGFGSSQMPGQSFGSSQMPGQSFGSSQMPGQSFGSSQMLGQEARPLRMAGQTTQSHVLPEQVPENQQSEQFPEIPQMAGQRRL